MSTAPATFGPARFVTTAIVAKYLGWSREHVRRKCENGTIPASKIDGGRWMIPHTWLRRILAERSE